MRSVTPQLRLGSAVASLVLGGTLFTLTSPHASAQTAGRAESPGSVTCSFTAVVKFSPPLTNTGGGTHPSSVKAALARNACFSDYAVHVAGRMLGSFAYSPLSCTTLSATGAPLNGTMNWTTGAHFGAGLVRWSPTIVNGSVASGSFAGAASVTINVPPTFAAGCASPQGVRTARVTGAFSSGPVCIGPDDPVTSGPVTVYTISGAPLCATTNATYFPNDIAAGSDGALWFTDSNGSIGRITTSGAITLYNCCRGADGITAGPDGALWFTDGGFAIGRMTTSGAVTFYTAPGIYYPTGITVGPDGALWFTNEPTAQQQRAGVYGSIGRMTTAGVVTIYTASGIDSPTGITAGPDGALWFTNGGYRPSASQDVLLGQSVGRITTSGVTTTYSDPSIDAPDGITSGPDGALWFVNGAAGNGSIDRITTSGTVTSYPDPTDQTTGPTGITTGPDGALWFTNMGSESAIGRITTSGTLTTYPVPSYLNPASPNAITVGSDGALWFVDRNGTIGRVTTP